MKVRYIGSEDLTEDTTTEVFGQTFEKGEWVESDAAPALIDHPMFEVAEAAPADSERPKPRVAAPAKKPIRKPAKKGGAGA